MSAHYLIGIVLYLHYVVGSLFANASGLTALPILALLGALVYRAAGLEMHRVTLGYATLLLVVSTVYFMIFEWTEYAMFKYSMFMLKAIPLLLIGSLIIRHREQYFLGVSHALVLFLLICMLFLAFANITAGVNDRLEIGIFNPIWISRGLFELVLILAIILKPRLSYTVAVLIASIAVAYYAGSKGPILAFLVSYLLWIRSQKGVGRRMRKFLIYSALIGAPLGIYLFVDPTSYVFQRFFLPVPEGTSAEVVEASRMIVWPATLSLFAGQDVGAMLFGNGIGSFPEFYFGNGADFRYYPHNILLELLIEHGLVITVGALVFFVSKIRASTSKFKYLLIYFLINSLFSGDLVLNEYIFFYLGLMIADDVETRRRGECQLEMVKV